MARSSLLTAGFLLALAAALPAQAQTVSDTPTVVPSEVATSAPTPLQEPHAVDQAPLPPLEQTAPRPARHRPAAIRSRAKAPPAKPQVATVTPKARPQPPEPNIAAKPAPAPLATKAKLAPHKLAQPRSRMLAKARPRPMRQARSNYEERPHSGPVYDTPPGAMMPSTKTPTGAGCDEACQYRDWLNRYAAWYRDFGRYYSSAPPRPAEPGRAAPPPMTYSENRPAPVPPPSYRFDQSERDRLDPWHGYNSRSPSNGY